MEDVNDEVFLNKFMRVLEKVHGKASPTGEFGFGIDSTLSVSFPSHFVFFLV